MDNIRGQQGLIPSWPLFFSDQYDFIDLLYIQNTIRRFARAPLCLIFAGKRRPKDLYVFAKI
jgi:hypothetical protein